MPLDFDAKGENIDNILEEITYLSSDVAARVQAEAKWPYFVNSSITLRVEMAVARFNSPTQMNVYISSIWTPCGSGKSKSIWSLSVWKV